MSHTPGPWKVREDGIGKNFKRTGTSFEVWGTPGYVASVGPLCAEEKQRANARLIAAAPEMFELIKETIGYIYCEEGAHARYMRRKLEDIIKKIEDKQAA